MLRLASVSYQSIQIKWSYNVWPLSVLKKENFIAYEFRLLIHKRKNASSLSRNMKMNNVDNWLARFKPRMLLLCIHGVDGSPYKPPTGLLTTYLLVQVVCSSANPFRVGKCISHSHFMLYTSFHQMLVDQDRTPYGGKKKRSNLQAT